MVFVAMRLSRPVETAGRRSTPSGASKGRRRLSWVSISFVDRDLVFQDFSLVLVPGMRLQCLARAGARGVRRFARTGEENPAGLSYARLVGALGTKDEDSRTTLFGTQPGGGARGSVFKFEFEHGIWARKACGGPSAARRVLALRGERGPNASVRSSAQVRSQKSFFKFEFEHGIRAREGALSPSSAAGKSGFAAEGWAAKRAPRDHQ
jgi:hypothetical protein